MAFTGLFLIFFLLIHAYVNANVLFKNGEENFNRAANFMSTNALIRIMEIGLFAGFIIHIVQGYALERVNRAARSSKYAVSGVSKTSTWYSRSMAILGTLILLFLVVHLAQLRLNRPAAGAELEALLAALASPFSLGLYGLAGAAVGLHLLQGYESAHRSLGWLEPGNRERIRWAGRALALLLGAAFGVLPIALVLRASLANGMP